MWNIVYQRGRKETVSPGIQEKNGKDQNKYTVPCPPDRPHTMIKSIYFGSNAGPSN